LVPLALLLGCGIFGSDENRLTVNVQYEIVTTTPVAEPTIVKISSAVQVNHQFQTKHPCYEFGASAHQNGTVVELELTMEEQSQAGCPAETTVWSYIALVMGAVVTSNRIGITHIIDDARTRTEHPIPPNPQ
jgi:hypothetical protein